MYLRIAILNVLEMFRNFVEANINVTTQAVKNFAAKGATSNIYRFSPNVLTNLLSPGICTETIFKHNYVNTIDYDSSSTLIINQKFAQTNSVYDLKNKII